MSLRMLRMYAEVMRDIEKKTERILKEYGIRDPGVMRKKDD